VELLLPRRKNRERYESAREETGGKPAVVMNFVTKKANKEEKSGADEVV
jgi:hypothetical protein